jgi:glutaredoxin
MFGTDWCSYCKKQKADFGDSFSGVNFYDCTMIAGDDSGNAAKKAEMSKFGVTSFPTWVIDGKSYPGYKSLSDLARISGYSVSEK